MKKALSILLCLAMLMSTVPMSVFAAPSAVATGDTLTENVGSGELVLENETYTVSYDKATGDTVGTMPQNADGINGEYTVSNVKPTREGYTFEGWTLAPGSDETVKKVTVNSDVTLYAKWGKGSYFVEFDNDGDKVKTNGVDIDLADGNWIYTCHAKDVSVDNAAGEASFTIDGNDFYVAIKSGFDKSINIDSVSRILLGVRSDMEGAGGFSMYFASKDADGNWIGPEYSTDKDRYLENQVKNISYAFDGDFKKVNVIEIDPTSKKDWQGYLDHIRIDLDNSMNFIGKKFIVDYIKLIGKSSVEVLEIETDAPKASAAVCGIDNVSVPEHKYTVANMSWSGSDLVDGKYYAENAQYTATYKLVAADGCVFSNKPLSATVNGEEAVIEGGMTDGETAIVTYTFPVTEDLVDFTLVVKPANNATAEITTSLGTLQLEKKIYTADGVVVPNSDVYWSIDKSQKKYAWVDENGLVTGNTDCEALVVTATSKYNPAIKETITIKISGQIPENTVTFESGTGEAVENLRPSELAKGEYELPVDIIPTREGYAFKGWSKEIGGDVITVDDVSEDKTYYAKWGHTRAEDFDGKTDVFKTKNHITSSSYEDGVIKIVPSNEKVNEGILLQSTDGVFHKRKRLLTDDAEYLEIKTNLAPDELEVCVYVMTGTLAGKELTPWNDLESANTRFYSNKHEIAANPEQNIFEYVTKNGDWYIYKFPTKYLKNWSNYLHQLRLNFILRDPDKKGNNEPDGIAWKQYPEGTEIKFDYIRFVGEDIPAMDIVDIATPVAAGEASKTATVVQNKAFEITGITWEPELLGGTIFDSATSYTVTMSLAPMKGYNSFSNPPARVTVNGNDATFVRETTERAKISYTFPATEDVGKIELVDITLNETGDNGPASETKQIISGKSFDLNKVVPSNVPTGYRWAGWSDFEGGEPIKEPVNVTSHVSYYALYEIIDEYDFSNEYHYNENCVIGSDAIVTHEGAWVVVTPEYDNSKAKLSIEDLAIKGVDYDYVEVVYDGSLEDEKNDNKFGENNKDVALTVYGQDGASYKVAISEIVPVIANNRVSYKYVYDLTVNGKPDTISKVELAPYSGLPAWAVTSVKFVPNVEIGEPVAVTGLEVPATWGTPDKEVEVNANYEVVSVDWIGESYTADKSFDADTAYTVKIVVKPKTGYKIIKKTASINGENLTGRNAVTVNANGTITLEKTYPATEKFAVFTMSVEDAVIDTPDATINLVAKLEGEKVPFETVKWSIKSNGPDGKSATLDEDTGLFTAVYDGDVVVVATSVYNPEVYTEATIKISNQIPYYTVKFDANTLSNVTGMPYNGEDYKIKGEYVLPAEAPVREGGFVFAGWLKDPSETVTHASATITEDTTFYALWVKGLSYEFIDGEKVIPENQYMSNPTYDTKEGTYSYKLVGNDPIIMIKKGGQKLFPGKEFLTMEIRFKVDKAGSYPLTMYFESVNEDGTVRGPSYDKDSTRFLANKTSEYFTLGEDEYITVTYDLSSKTDWTGGYPTSVRLDLPDSDATGTTFTVDYIRFVNYETSVVEVTGVDAPIAGKRADLTSESLDSNKYEVVDVSWSGTTTGGVSQGLLPGNYFAGLTNYTVSVKVKGVPGSFVSNAPSVATVNGNPAKTSYDKDSEILTLSYTFPATGEFVASTTHTITLVEKNDAGADVSVETVVFEGDTLDLGTTKPTSIPKGKRWIGWSEVAGSAQNTAPKSITVTAPATYYAVYEDLVEFDFSNYYHQDGMKAEGKGKLSFENGLAIVQPSAYEAFVELHTPDLNVNSLDFSYVEVYYSTEIDSIYKGNVIRNKFYENLKPILGYKYANDESKTYAATIQGAERVVIDGLNYMKYTYYVSWPLVGKGAPVGKLILSPYVGYPDWGVRLIKLIPSIEMTETPEFFIEAPVVGEYIGRTEATIKDGGMCYARIGWSKASDPDTLLTSEDVFEPNTKYIAHTLYEPYAGVKIATANVVVNGKNMTSRCVDGYSYAFDYEFEATGGYKPVSVTISGDQKITGAGSYIQLSADVKADDGSFIPNTSVTWSVVNKDSTLISALAEISPETGRLYPISNGTVVVTATSNYDSSKVSAPFEVVISGQKELYTVTFDPNTTDEVKDMPGSVKVIGSFTPEATYPKRDGYFFLGWSTDEDALKPETSFNITQDTTLYAKWAFGREWTFDNESTSIKPYHDRETTYKEGIATVAPKGTASQVVLSSSGLLELGIETSKHREIQIRFSTPMETGLKWYLQSASEDGTQVSAWDETASIVQYGFPANNPGEFQTASFDLSKHQTWTTYPYVETIRLDLPQAGPTQTVQFDWIRLISNERDVKFDGNGGLIPLYGGYVSSVKQTHGLGEITLPETPVREGYTFIGWAKSTGNYKKLYNGSFTVTDHVTLYAIWTPATALNDQTVGTTEKLPDDATITKNDDFTVTIKSPTTAITPVVEVNDSVTGGDAIVVGNNKTVIIKLDADYASDVTGDIVLEYKDENQQPGSIKIPYTSLSGETEIVYDLSGEADFTGTLTDVKITLPNGVINDLTIKEIIFTTAEQADSIGGAGESTGPVVGADDATVSIPGAGYPGPVTYPALGGGSITEQSQINSKTPADKKPSVPERPKDDEEPKEDSGNNAGTTKPSTGSSDKFAFTKTYDGRFTDVTSANWFYSDVEKSFKLDLMEGKSETTFVPEGNVTLAEAITVAARMNAIYNKTEVPASAAGEPWYKGAVDYATKKAIITSGQYSDFTALATREQVAVMFVRALPSSWYNAINVFVEIPDVPATNASKAAIIRLYNAGVVIGVDDNYNFKPSENIKRSELSAIINRVALKDSRIREVTEAEKANLTKIVDTE